MIGLGLPHSEYKVATSYLLVTAEASKPGRLRRREIRPQGGRHDLLEMYSLSRSQ